MITPMRQYMAEKKVNGKELSKITGISTSSLYKYSCGERVPPVKSAKKIAAALGFPWTRFYEEQK